MIRDRPDTRPASRPRGSLLGVRPQVGLLGGLAALLILWLTACSDGGGGDPAAPDPPTPPPVAVATVQVASGGSWVLSGDAVQMSVELRAANGQVLSGRSVDWSSSHPARASVSGAGLVQLLDTGTVTITATSEGQTGAAQLHSRPGGGLRVPALAGVDSVAVHLRESLGLPGLAIGISRHERLVFLRGYGWADVPAGEVLGPDHMFRVASLSKPLATAAILKLVEEGQLSLDARVFDVLDHLEPPPGATPDPRLGDIQVRHLIHHTGGWDRVISGDWTYPPYVQQAASDLGVPSPPTAEEVVRWVMGRPLDFDPGARYAYSNIGYSVMARIVEKLDGRSYEDFVQEEILVPAGATRMRVGRTFFADRYDGEVRYHGSPMVQSIFPGVGVVEQAYGGFSVEARDGQGAWVSSPADYLRFLHAIDGQPVRPDVISAASHQWINTRPSGPAFASTSGWYSGFSVNVQGANFSWSHSGGLPGTTTFVFRRTDGVAYVIFTNGAGASASDFNTVLGAPLSAATNWPDHDLFSSVP